MSNQTEKKSNMENPSAQLPPRPPLSSSLEKQPCLYEDGPYKTMFPKDLKLAREEALKMLSSQTKKEGTKEVEDKKVMDWKKACTSGWPKNV